MKDDSRPIGYDDLDDDQKEALSLIQRSMSDYDRGIRDATDSLSKRIVALEILLQQKTMRVRHLEEKIAEMRSGLKIGNKYNHPKDPNDRQ